MNTDVAPAGVLTLGLLQICCLLSILSFSACGKQEPGFEKRGCNKGKEFTIKVSGVDYFSCIIKTNDDTGTPYENDIEEEDDTSIIAPSISFAEEEAAILIENNTGVDNTGGEEFIAPDAYVA